MKAAVFREVGQPLAVEEVPDPKATGADLVLQVKSCGICGSDLHVADQPPGLPGGTVMGHEFAGEVVEVGPEAGPGWKVGDRVVAQPFIGCGRCRACLSGDGSRCAEMKATGLGGVPGAYAEFVRVGTAESLRLPDSVGWHGGALVEPLAVGLHAVNEASLVPGENVLVIGAGPIGLATALWARFQGARSVVVSEKAAGRLVLAERFGATATIDASKEIVASAFEREAGGPPDVIFECVGVPGMIQQCLGLAPARSRIVVVGVCMQPDTFFPGMGIVKELTLKFVVAYRQSDFRFTIDMLDAERIHAESMVTDVVGLDAFADAFEALKKPTTQCKVMLEPGS
ncbi:MAG: alcohol dehydrogenase catalytic domain-containing protein [Myxococcota bacterium]